jgi:hypothetical protein
MDECEGWYVDGSSVTTVIDQLNGLSVLLD